MNNWDIAHAIDFWERGAWTFDFAANWLGVSEKEFRKMIFKVCPACHGTGEVKRSRVR